MGKKKLIGFLYDKIETKNNVGKGENAGLPAFSPFPTLFFSKAFLLSLGCIEVDIVQERIQEVYTMKAIELSLVTILLWRKRKKKTSRF